MTAGHSSISKKALENKLPVHSKMDEDFQDLRDRPGRSACYQYFIINQRL